MERTKIVIDTNIFISAFWGSKNAKFLLKEVINDEYELVMSKDQLKEIDQVLKRPKFSKFISEGEVNEFVSNLSLKILMPAIYENIYHFWPEYPHLLNYLVALASGKWGMNGCFQRVGLLN